MKSHTSSSPIASWLLLALLVSSTIAFSHKAEAADDVNVVSPINPDNGAVYIDDTHPYIGIPFFDIQNSETGFVAIQANLARCGEYELEIFLSSKGTGFDDGGYDEVYSNDVTAPDQLITLQSQGTYLFRTTCANGFPSSLNGVRVEKFIYYAGTSTDPMPLSDTHAMLGVFIFTILISLSGVMWLFKKRM